MNDVVDYFVLVEATKTFSNKPKDLFYKNNAEQFTEYANKIIHVIVDDIPDGQDYQDNWKREAHQRNGISKGLARLDLNSEDLVLISDVDEVVDSNIIRTMVQNRIATILAINLVQYYYNLNCIALESCVVSKVLPFGLINHFESIEHIRKYKAPLILNPCGWHLSYFGSTDFIINKIKSFSHQEYNNDEYLDGDKIKQLIAKGKDIFYRDCNPIKMVAIKDNNYLPKNYQMIKTNEF
jgi:beta-1,4-mannosyl-glycoprotein beta-1,4-N-acetylglucosaminyltransferase